MNKNQHKNFRSSTCLETLRQEIEDYLQNIHTELPEFIAQEAPIPLSGGLLNFVWRIIGQTGSTRQSLIAK